jgi:molecular chaperone IbpA
MNAITFPRSAFIGFDQLFNELESSVWKDTQSYPPHNIIKISEEKFAIELAVAGFSMDAIDITVKDGELFVAGKAEKKDKNYVHKGISSRHFQKAFKLQEHVEVTDANLSDGILSISLELKVPEEKKPKSIKINKGEPEYLKG